MLSLMLRALPLLSLFLAATTLSSRPEAHSAAVERPASLRAPILLPAPSGRDASPAPAPQAVIWGRVVDSKGLPVADARVWLFAFSGPTGLPHTVTTHDGFFLLKSPPFGKGVVSAYKTIAGFPDAENALYGRWAYPSVAQINATPGANIHTDLKFSPPDALIEWTVVSKSHRDPIFNASYTIEWSDDPKTMAISTIQSSGFFRFVLPKHPVVVRIEAPGFKEWTSTDAAAFGRPLLLKPGTIDRRSIMLDPK